MADVTLFEGETRTVTFPVSATTDPLADVVKIAFIVEGADPQPADWRTAAWKTGQTWTAGQPVYVEVTIGPTHVALTPGTYCAVLDVADTTDNPWIPAGTVRIRAAIPVATLRQIRDEVGGSPPDDEIADLYLAHGQSVAVTALAILRPRLADALNDRSLSIPGVISVGAPQNPQYLRDQISRLEAAIVDPADDDGTGTAGMGRLTRRSQRRGLPWSL